MGLLANTIGDNSFSNLCPQSYHLNYYQSIDVTSSYLQTSAFHPVYSDSNTHLNWPFASHDKAFFVLCGQLELEKPKHLNSQTGMSGLTIPGFSLHSTNFLDRSSLF
jgi:hypothetical protein